MKKSAIFFVLSLLLLAGAGCTSPEATIGLGNIDGDTNQQVNSEITRPTPASGLSDAASIGQAEPTAIGSNAVSQSAADSSDVDDENGLVITGQVTNSITNRPLPNVAVNVAYSSISTRTDVNGGYILRLPAAGSFSIYAAADWFESAGSTLISGSGRQTANLTLRPTERVGRTNVIPEAKYVPGQTGLKVTVKDRKTGRGVPWVGFLTVMAGVPGSQNRKTDAAGYFFDRDIPAGSYRFGLMQFKSSVGIEYAVDIGGATNDYLIQVMNGYTTEVEIEVDAE